MTLGLLGLGCTLLPACGPKEEQITLVPVSGKVTVGGEILPIGQVALIPDASKGNTTIKQPSGKIQEDGTYKIETGTANGNREGAPPGWYRVVINVGSPGTPDQMKLKIPEVGLEYKEQKKTKLTIEVKEGAPPGAYDIKIPKAH